MDKLNKAEGIDIVKVPYRGGGEVVNAVLGGTTPIAVLALSNMVSQLQSGRITPLAVVANSRSPLFPDVPTLGEVRPGADFPTTWFGLFTQSRRAAADRREDRRRRRPHHGRAGVPQAHVHRPRASSPRPSGSTRSPASSATSASSPSRSSRSPGMEPK